MSVAFCPYTTPDNVQVFVNPASALYVRPPSAGDLDHTRIFFDTQHFILVKGSVAQVVEHLTTF